MTVDDQGLGARVAALREAFDRRFAVPVEPPQADAIDLLAIRVGGHPYAFDLAELSGLTRARAIVPLPSRRAELLGVAGIRGGLWPVYDLPRALGHETGPGPLPWLAQCAGAAPLALAFERVDGLLRVPRADLARLGAEVERRHVSGFVRDGGATRMIVDLKLLRGVLDATAGAPGATKEQ